jgi:entericidin B
MKHLLSLTLLAIAALFLTSCNTIKGAGQDVSAAGRDVTKAASTVERKISN